MQLFDSSACIKETEICVKYISHRVICPSVWENWDPIVKRPTKRPLEADIGIKHFREEIQFDFYNESKFKMKPFHKISST